MKAVSAFTMMLFVMSCPAAQALKQEITVNPIQKVLTMLSDLAAKISAEGAEAKKVYEETMVTCEDRSKQLAFEIKTGKAEVADLTAAIAKEVATATALTTKIEELAASVSSDEADLEKAKGVRAEEAADFAAMEKETTEIMGTLTRAIGILEKEMAGGASMMQLQSSDTVAQALSVMVQASALSSADATKLTALVQQGEDDSETGAPAGEVYTSKSGGIVATLTDLLDKAQEQLTSAQKEETAKIRNFALLEQSLEDSIKNAEEDLSAAKKSLAASAETKAGAEGDLEVTSKDLDEDTKTLASTKTACATAASDYEASSASRTEELEAVAKAKSVIAEATGGAESITYSLSQVSLLQVARTELSSGVDLANFEAIHFVRDLARKQHAPELAQLAMRMANAIHSGSRQDPFAKVKGLIMDMIEKLEKEAGADASHKAYCDEQTGETETAIEEKTSSIEKLSTKIDVATAASSKLKEEVAALQKELADTAKSQAEVDGHGQIVQNGCAEDIHAKEAPNHPEVLGKEALKASSFDDTAQGCESDVVNVSLTPSLANRIKEHEGARGLTVAKTLRFKTFHLLDVWSEENAPRSKFTRIQCVSIAERLQSSIAAEVSEGDDIVLSYEGFCGRLISAPGSPYRLIWDFVGAAFIFYDLFTIPLQVFSIQDGPYVTFSTVLDWTTLLFWTANVFASLTVGYVDRGLIVMEPVKILRNYFKVWFWVDSLVVVPDWIFTIAATNGDEKSEAGSSVKLLRILRLVRMVRLVRLFKLRKIMQDVNDHIDSEYVSIIASIIKMIMALLAINHFIACAWYGIAIAFQHSNTSTWIKAHGFEGDRWYYMYATAFHWSITQFTPSSMQVQPQNMTERSFAVFIVVFALVGFSYLVGGIISHIGQLRSMREDSAKQFWNLRRYLRQNSVPMELSIRIQRYLEHAWARKQATLQTSDIKIFSMLSDQLQSELKCALALPHLFVHPLFEQLEKVSFVTSHRLAHAAIDHTLLAADDNLFIPGEIANYMYVVVKGRLQYFRFDSSGYEHKEWVDKAEDWIAEPVLWTTGWVHLGLLVACKECDLLTVRAKAFVDCVKRNPQASEFLSNYARNFLLWLNLEHRDSLSDIYQGEVISPLVVKFMEEEFDPESSLVMGRCNEGLGQGGSALRFSTFSDGADIGSDHDAQNSMSMAHDEAGDGLGQSPGGLSSNYSPAKDENPKDVVNATENITARRARPAPGKESSTLTSLPSQIPSPPQSPPHDHLTVTPDAPKEPPVVMTLSPNDGEAAPVTRD